MDIVITHRHLQPRQAVDEFVRQKIDKLSRFGEKLLGVSVVLEELTDGNSRAEILVHSKRHRFTAHAEADEIHAAINIAEKKMETQLRRHRRRMQGHRERALADVPLY